jgi:hypothetical protein
MAIDAALLAGAAAVAEAAGADADAIDAGAIALGPALLALLAFLLGVGAANTEGERKRQSEPACDSADDVAAGVTGHQQSRQFVEMLGLHATTLQSRSAERAECRAAPDSLFARICQADPAGRTLRV